MYQVNTDTWHFGERANQFAWNLSRTKILKEQEGLVRQRLRCRVALSIPELTKLIIPISLTFYQIQKATAATGARGSRFNVCASHVRAELLASVA